MQSLAFSLGAAAHNSLSLFLDESGSDHYAGAVPGDASNNDYHGGTSLGLFLDLGPGRDRYERGGLAPGEQRVTGAHGLAADLPGLPSPAGAHR